MFLNASIMFTAMFRLFLELVSTLFRLCFDLVFDYVSTIFSTTFRPSPLQYSTARCVLIASTIFDQILG